jgi:hypothetical protein
MTEIGAIWKSLKGTQMGLPLFATKINSQWLALRVQSRQISRLLGWLASYQSPTSVSLKGK